MITVYMYALLWVFLYQVSKHLTLKQTIIPVHHTKGFSLTIITPQEYAAPTTKSAHVQLINVRMFSSLQVGFHGQVSAFLNIYVTVNAFLYLKISTPQKYAAPATKFVHVAYDFQNIVISLDMFQDLASAFDLCHCKGFSLMI